MPTFEFKGRDRSGKEISGERFGSSEDALGAQLIREGITPIRIKRKQEATSLSEQLDEFFKKRVSNEEVSMFARQMHTLCKTGVPITSALKLLADNARGSRLTRVLSRVVDYLEAGQDLAESMQHFPEVFSPIMVSMIRVGQSSGQLDAAFLRLNQYLEMEGGTLQKVKAALRYPTFVMIAIVSAIILVNVFVVPTFANIFAQNNLKLPTLTVILITISQFTLQYWVYILMVLAVIGAVIYHQLHTPAGKLAWHKFKLDLPIIGRLLKRIVLLRFAQTFGVTVNAGITIPEGLTLAARSIDNAYAEHEIMEMFNAVQRGNTLAQAAQGTALFTALEVQMLKVSEETGELGNMLEQIAIFYQREVDYDLKRMNDIIEPLLLVALAGMIMMLAFAIYLPMWDLVKIVHT